VAKFEEMFGPPATIAYGPLRMDRESARTQPLQSQSLLPSIAGPTASEDGEVAGVTTGDVTNPGTVTDGDVTNPGTVTDGADADREESNGQLAEGGWMLQISSGTGHDASGAEDLRAVVAALFDGLPNERVQAEARILERLTRFARCASPSPPPDAAQVQTLSTALATWSRTATCGCGPVVMPPTASLRLSGSASDVGQPTAALPGWTRPVTGALPR
jgi:hypothetical protein